MLGPSSPQWLHLLIGPQVFGVVGVPDSENLILLHDRFTVRALQLVGGVRLKRVLVAVRALMTLRHDRSFRWLHLPQWQESGADPTREL